jgi:hypothetical protein
MRSNAVAIGLVLVGSGLLGISSAGIVGIPTEVAASSVPAVVAHGHDRHGDRHEDHDHGPDDD